MNGYQTYRNADVSTADRGKLVLMVYDHCIRWMKKAVEELNSANVEGYSRAIFKAQDGLTELTCALDFEKGGEIAKNLFNLYDFYSRHLTQALSRKSPAPVEEVLTMMHTLREGWVVAIDNVRKSNRTALQDNSTAQLSMVG